MKKVYMHLGYMRARSAAVIRAERDTREEVELPNGSRIISLPASPDTVRGFSGNVFLDEFAFHTNSQDIWRAMYPAVTRGYRVRITSTPNGKQNTFYRLWAQDGRFSRHMTDIYRAAAEGLEVDVDGLRRGISDPEAWAQEFECRFLDEATAYLTYEMIAACEDAGASAVLVADRHEQEGEFYLGVDIARRRDLTVLWLLQKVGDVFWTRAVKEMRAAPFVMQRDLLYSLMQDCGVLRCCIDASGIGAQIAEEARQRFGPRVEAVTFTNAVKEDLALRLRRHMEERTLRVPPLKEIREDLHSVGKTLTPSGAARFEADRSGGAHADRFWALALALHAGGSAPPRMEYETLGQRAHGLERAGCW